MIDYNCIEDASYDPMEIFSYIFKLCNFSQIYIVFFTLFMVQKMQERTKT